MKKADLYTAAVLALVSVYVMIKSAELPVGWISGEGPGGGAFPFWLALGMLVCSVLIFVRNLLRLSTEGRSEAMIMDGEAARLLFIVVASLAMMILLVHVVGVYLSVPLFMIFYMRYLGRHPWKIVALISLSTPVLTFILFEKLLLILLPKGVTEPLFYIFF